MHLSSFFLMPGLLCPMPANSPAFLSYNATAQSACNSINTAFVDFYSQRSVATGCGALASVGCGLVPTCKPSVGVYNGLGYPLDNDFCFSVTEAGVVATAVRICRLLPPLRMHTLSDSC